MSTETRRTIHHVLSSTAIVVATAFGSGCDRPQDVTTPSVRTPSSGSRAQVVTGSKLPRREEDLFVQLARAEPSLAGFFMDSQGNFVLQVADSTKFDLARSAFRQHLNSNDVHFPKAFLNRPVLARKVKYSFQQLSDWRDLVVDSLLGTRGAVIDDLDEVRNRVMIGVDPSYPGGQSETRRRLVDLGIPAEAVIVEAMAPPRFANGRARSATSAFLSAAYLTSHNDTIGGGYEIQVSGGGVCTAGLVVDRSGTRGLITNSHCSTTMYHLDSDNYYAPYTPAGPIIGHETVDPAGWSCGGSCLRRNSDVLFIALDSVGRRGAVARTQGRTSGSIGVTSILSTDPWTNMNTDSPSIFSGLTVDKTGMKSGWTYGSVTATCQDFTSVHGGTTYSILCNDLASVFTKDGDSGAPVYTWDGTSGGSFLGLVDGLQAGCADDCSAMYFTPLSQIVQDLGSITVTSEITVGTPSVTASMSGGNPYLSWSAVSTTHTTATTHYRVMRAIWDASTYTWTTEGTQIADLTGTTSYTDTAAPFSVSYYGTTQPESCTYSFVFYWVVAYNAGITAGSGSKYFVGPADGPNPEQHGCT